MKAKAITNFFDTEAKVVRQRGDVFSITPARFNVISRKGRYIEVYEPPVKPTEEVVAVSTEENE